VGRDVKLLNAHGEPGASVVNVQILTAIRRIRRTGNPKLKIIEENYMKWICDVIYNVT